MSNIEKFGKDAIELGTLYSNIFLHSPGDNSEAHKKFSRRVFEISKENIKANCPVWRRAMG